MTNARVLDLEVQNNPWYGNDVGSPNCPDNYIVAAAWQDVELNLKDVKSSTHTEVHSYYFNSKEEEAGTNWFNLDGVDILVAHNAMYELHWFITRYSSVLVPALKRGMRVWCTALGRYLVTHQQELYPKLDETAPVYGGTHKIDAVKVLWDQGKKTSEIDRKLLMEYLAGEHGDVVNTRLCLLGEIQELQQQGMFLNFVERCEGMLAYAFCVSAGLHIDREAFRVERAAQQAKLESIDAEINQLLPEDLPEELEFNWGSLYHKSALLFGGQIKYTGKGSYEPKKYIKADYYQDSVTGEYSSIHLTEPDEPVRYKSGKNKGMPKVFTLDTDTEKLKNVDKFYTFKGLVSINSLPKDAKEKFYAPEKGRTGEWVSKLQLPDGSYVKSTSGDVLEYLAAQGFKAGKLLADRIGIVKDISSFYDGLEDFIQPDDLVHHQLNITSTVTGRLSSGKPNLQQLPRADKDDATGEYKSRVKAVYNSRWGEQGRIVSADYSNLETVMNCAMSGDTKLLAALLDGTDIHCKRLAYRLGEDYEEVKLKCKDESHPEHEKYKQLRTAIKGVGFASTYGASAAGLAYSCGVSIDFANEFLENEARLWPDMIKFRQVMLDEVEETGASGGVHREQAADGTWKLYRRGYYQSKTGTRYSFREYPSWNEGQEVYQYKKTQVANYAIQGEAAFLMTVTMGRIIRWLIANDFFGGKAHLINHVHDAAYADCQEDVAERVGKGIKAIMESTPKYIARKFNWPEIGEIPFPADAEMGINMLEQHHIQ